MALTARRFQRSQRLEEAARNAPPLERGASGEAVEILQQALIDLGFPMKVSTARSGMPDGIFGAETDATVRAFQRRQALSVDGVVGRHTLGRLDALIAVREAAERARMVVEANAPPPLSPWYLT